MSISLRKRTSASSVIALALMLFSVATAVAEGTGAGNGTGGVQPPLSLEPGSGMGNGTGGPVLPTVFPSQIVTATLDRKLSIVTIQCAFRWDPSYRYQKQGDNYDLVREKRETEKVLETKSSWTSILAQDYETKVTCTKTIKEFTTVDQLELTRTTAARIDAGVIGKEPVLKSGAVFLSVAYVTDGDRKLYQSTDPSKKTSEEAEEIYRDLTEDDKIKDVVLVSPKNWPNKSTVNSTKIRMVGRAIELAKTLAEDQAAAAIVVSYPPAFSFNWKNSELPSILTTVQAVSAGIRREPNSQVAIGPDIVIPTQITPIATENLAEINRWLAEKGAAGLLSSISDRPSVIAYLSNADHDRAVLGQFRARILTPLRPTANASALGRNVYVALLTAFASRAAVTAHAELQITSPVFATARPLTQPAVSSSGSLYLLASTEVLRDEGNLLQGRFGCGELACPSIESDMKLIGGLGDAITNNLKILNSWTFPTEDYEPAENADQVAVDRLSQDGCAFVLKLIRAVAEFHNNYLVYAKELGTDKNYAGHPYVKQIFAVLGTLNDAKYRDESPEQFVTKTLPDWERKCRDTTVKEIKDALGKIKPNTVSRIQRELQKYTTEP